MGERKDLLKFARRARVRQGLVRGVEVGLRALFWALCVALVAVLAGRLFGFTLPVLHGTIGLAALVVLSGLTAVFLPRIALLEAAAAVDERAGWKERLSSALSLPTVNHPMEIALVEDVRGRLKDRPVSEFFPFRAPRELRFSPFVAAAVAGAVFLMPSIDVFGLAKAAADRKKDRQEIAFALQKLEQRKKDPEKTERASDKVKDAVKKMDVLAAEMSKNPPQERKDALAQVSNLADELKKMKEDLSKAQALAQQLQKAASKEGADAGELGRLFREGKFGEAVQELAKMRNKMQEGKMTEAEREKLRQQMQALAEKLAKNKDLNEIEKKLAKAMQGMQENDEKKLDDLQQALGQMDVDQNDAEALADALKDLEDLADQLAKGQKECPS